MELDFPQVAAELVRALRGARSQLALSRRLRFRTNVIYSWESGNRSPSASQLLLLAERVGVELPLALGSLYPDKLPAWLSAGAELTTPDTVATLLRDARGAVPIVHLAERTGFSRFALARWQNGEAEPRAWEFLKVLHHSTHRLIDFLDPFTRGKPLSSLESEYGRLHAARRVAERFPLSQALLRCFELQSYLGSATEGSFALALGIAQQDEQEMTQLLEATGQIQRQNGRWRVDPSPPLNMRLSRDTAQKHRAFWAQLAAERAPASGDAVCAYNVCGVSLEGYQALRLLQKEYLQKARALIEKSEPVERVALLQVNLVTLAQEASAPSDVPAEPRAVTRPPKRKARSEKTSR